MAVSDLIALSDLLDQALDLDDRAREPWLAELNRTDPGVASRLKALLSRRAELETDHVLIAQGRSVGPEVLAKVIDRPSDVQTAANFQLQEGAAIGPYRLIRALGEGGMASVWLADRSDGQLKRQVALKLLHSWRNSKELVERFARERDMLAGLVHPNIARLYDAGVTPTGQPWIALEYVEGLDLAVYADRNQLSIRQRVESILQVMSAVQHAHQNLIVHRDIKPRNILVNKKGEVRLLDFGIAKLLQADAASADETELTKNSGRALTLRYAAPEQIEGKPITTATDVYALGLVLYELLTGTSPRINHKTGVLNERSALSTDVLRPSRGTFDVITADARGHVTPKEMKSTLNGDLDTIVLKALAREPQRRYPTVSAFAADLTAWLERRPIAARAPTLSYQLRMFVSRQRVPVAVGALAMSALGVAGLYGWQQNNLANQQRARAEHVQTFMANLLSDAEPDGVEGARGLTAKSLLDAGVIRARAEYASQPLLRGEMLAELARVYLRIGETQAAAKIFDDAIALLEKNAAGEPSLFIARAHYGGHLLRQGERERGVAMLSAVIRECPRHDAKCSQALGTAHLQFAYDPLLSDVDRLVHSRAAVSAFESDIHTTSSARNMMHALSHSAEFERSLGNLREARELFDRAYAMQGGLGIKLTERTLLEFSRTNLAFDEGNYDLAANIAEQLLSGPLAPKRKQSRLYSYVLRAHIANYQGLTEVALANALEARRLSSDLEPTINLAYAQRYEARALAMSGEFARAAAVADEAFDVLRKIGVAENSEAWLDMQRLRGEISARAGDYAEAKRIFSQTLSTLRERYPRQLKDRVNTLSMLGATALAVGDAAFAHTCHAEELDLINALPESHPVRLRARLFFLLAEDSLRPAADNRLRIAEVVAQLQKLLPPQSVHQAVLAEIVQGKADRTRRVLIF